MFTKIPWWCWSPKSRALHLWEFWTAFPWTFHRSAAIRDISQWNCPPWTQPQTRSTDEIYWGFILFPALLTTKELEQYQENSTVEEHLWVCMWKLWLHRPLDRTWWHGCLGHRFWSEDQREEEFRDNENTNFLRELWVKPAKWDRYEECCERHLAWKFLGYSEGLSLCSGLRWYQPRMINFCISKAK